jgi:hypothetical protein
VGSFPTSLLDVSPELLAFVVEDPGPQNPFFGWATLLEHSEKQVSELISAYGIGVRLGMPEVLELGSCRN